MGQVQRARETLQVCVCFNKLGSLQGVNYPHQFPHSETTFQHPSSSTHTERDHHGQSSQLVELCKRFELSDDDINKEVSDKHILKIYPQLEKWKRVAAHLGLTQADVQAIESGARSDEELMRMYMLQEWMRKKRLHGTATYQVLLEALIECNCSESAIQVCKLMRTHTTPHHTMPHHSP